MPPHRDWTRHGVGRALLWWPFTAFVAVAAFPALAVPGVVATGVLLIVVGLVGGAVGRRRRERRLREARRAVTAFAPRRVREARGRDAAAVPRETVTAGSRNGRADDDAEADKRSDLGWSAA